MPRYGQSVQWNCLDNLLEHGLQANLRNHKGNSLLMLAAMFNRTGIVEFLLVHGADIDVRAANGMYALDAARAMGAPDTPVQLARRPA